MEKPRINRTKAETLQYLSKKAFPIPSLYYFMTQDWVKDQEKILSNIISKFNKNNFIAVRSSSLAEDKKKKFYGRGF
tara:strand:+ start:719 stop:949 length:231 start_codon:yes stop_codon:yes gene_type:complete